MELKIAEIKDLYRDDHLVEDRQPEGFRVTYTRRGSDVQIGSTLDGKNVQVTKVVHKGNVQRTYRYAIDEIDQGKKAILDALSKDGFKLKERPAPVTETPEPPPAAA